MPGCYSTLVFNQALLRLFWNSLASKLRGKAKRTQDKLIEQAASSLGITWPFSVRPQLPPPPNFRESARNPTSVLVLISNLIFYSFLKDMMHSNPLSEVWLSINLVSAHSRQHFLHSGCEYTNRASPQWEKKKRFVYVFGEQHAGQVTWATGAGLTHCGFLTCKGTQHVRNPWYSSDQDQTLCPAFSLRARNVCPLFSNTKEN